MNEMLKHIFCHISSSHFFIPEFNNNHALSLLFIYLFIYFLMAPFNEMCLSDFKQYMNKYAEKLTFDLGISYGC